MDYYRKQLDLINFSGPQSAHVIFGSDGTATKALAVNAESAAVIIQKLVEVFIYPGMPKPESAAPAALASDPREGRPYVSFENFMDRNGNKCLRVKSSRGSFSVQTNNRHLRNTLRDGITWQTYGEIFAWVQCYGTERQRHIMGVL